MKLKQIEFMKLIEGKTYTIKLLPLYKTTATPPKPIACPLCQYGFPIIKRR